MQLCNCPRMVSISWCRLTIPQDHVQDWPCALRRTKDYMCLNPTGLLGNAPPLFLCLYTFTINGVEQTTSEPLTWRLTPNWHPCPFWVISCAHSRFSIIWKTDPISCELFEFNLNSLVLQVRPSRRSTHTLVSEGGQHLWSSRLPKLRLDQPPRSR